MQIAHLRRLPYAGVMTLLLSLCLGCTPSLPPAEPLSDICIAVDGDTLRCGEERVRLVGIDAPEMPGHCRKGRVCADGDPYAAKEALRKAAENHPLWIIRLGQDRYGRTIGLVGSGSRNMSCTQIEGGHAIYRGDWDNRKAVARTCAKVVATRN